MGLSLQATVQMRLCRRGAVRREGYGGSAGAVVLGHSRGAPLKTAVVCSSSPQHWSQGDETSGMGGERENLNPAKSPWPHAMHLPRSDFRLIPAATPRAPLSLLQCRGEQGSEVLGHLERIDSDVDGRDAIGRAFLTGQHVRGGALLKGDVVIVLQEEVRHHLGVCSRL
eukprot:scaffold111347_cov66-Phaeocystis_antarctica.AAC.1